MRFWTTRRWLSFDTCFFRTWYPIIRHFDAEGAEKTQRAQRKSITVEFRTDILS